MMERKRLTHVCVDVVDIIEGRVFRAEQARGWQDHAVRQNGQSLHEVLRATTLHSASLSCLQ